MDRIEFKAYANFDGTVTIVHYGTTFRHFWIPEIKPNSVWQNIYGKWGGMASIRITASQKIDLARVQIEAQNLAMKADGICR